jgi:hypothetical protein
VTSVKTTLRTHLLDLTFGGIDRTYCALASLTQTSSTTSDPAEATCRLCLKAYTASVTVMESDTANGDGRCFCGCGMTTPVARKTDRSLGCIRGQHVRYVQGHNGNAPPARFRLFSQLLIDPSGCLLWTGKINRHGYGVVMVDGKRLGVHRVMYEMFVGPIPDGLELDHLCHTRDLGCLGGKTCLHRRCASPAHLEPVTTRENVLRGKRRYMERKRSAA